MPYDETNNNQNPFREMLPNMLMENSMVIEEMVENCYISIYMMIIQWIEQRVLTKKNEGIF